MTVMDIAEQSWIPDALIRAGIRQRVRQRLQEAGAEAKGDPARYVEWFSEQLKDMPIAIHTRDANEQHYELPPEFFLKALGPRLKYSSAYWPVGVRDLAAAEEAMLSLYARRAEIEGGQRILDLGCGWGSLSLYLAEKYPDCSITAVSNSAPQRRFIEARADERGFTNLEVITADIREFETDQTFDRVVSIEMFEHMKNYDRLFEKISRFLEPDGKLFVHVFAHRHYAYHFDATNVGEWMARYFFTGGLMPSYDLLPRFQEHLTLERMWPVSGTHYEKTANAWLRNMDAARKEIMPLMREVYGEEADRWWQRWRIFFMSCAELFGYANGDEWIVAHYLFGKDA